ncbi:MAG: hypothetical protein JNK94_02835 [Hyphomonadaceae bacterium]|nr:hypothetical protein [Hyphomonadaceae bacterium]
MVEALAQAAWAEADAALARALADADVLTRLVKKSGPAVEGALAMLRQSLGQAARKRGLTRLEEAGARAAFDPNRHVLIKISSKQPKDVRIVIPGVVRGETILVKAEATPVSPRRKR